MTTPDVTTSPSTALPGQVLGRPVRIPAVLMCRAGERWCGQSWVANTRLQYPEQLTARRVHERDCRGGPITSG